MQAEIVNLPSGKGETVLIVDDEEYILHITKRLLTRHGYCVLSAGNGVDAKRIYEQNSNVIRLVLLDYMMPVLDGLKLANELYHMNPKVKIILSSGITELLTDDIITEFKSYGVVGQISKPCTASILLNMVYAVFNKSVSEEQALTKKTEIY